MSLQEHPPKLITPGVIATELKERLHRVLYVLRTRGRIRPSAFAGRIRLYDRAALEMVRRELRAIDARSCAGRPGQESANEGRRR